MPTGALNMIPVLSGQNISGPVMVQDGKLLTVTMVLVVTAGQLYPSDMAI